MDRKIYLAKMKVFQFRIYFSKYFYLTIYGVGLKEEENE